MNIPLEKKIGIWGFGATGKSAVRYFHPRCHHIEVLDQKSPNAADQEFLTERNIEWFGQEDLQNFLERNDYILPSPGIDLAPYAKNAHKFLNELDLFYASWHKPIIAITGSIGKTTITHLLSMLLKKVGLEVATGGNIGTPMLDLLPLQNSHDVALLELSSFQLEHCKKFAPDLAIITNLYPNHLDRHLSEQEYLRAKINIFMHQNDKQVILMPLELKENVLNLIPSALQVPSGKMGKHSSIDETYLDNKSPEELNLKKEKTSSPPSLKEGAFATELEGSRGAHKKHSYYFTLQAPAYPVDAKLYCVQENIIQLLSDPTSPRLRRAGTNAQPSKKITDISQFPPITFQENWLIIQAVFDILKLTMPDLSTIELHVPEHRLEKVATIGGVDFYNDSKSTTTQSTLAAVERLKSNPVLLLLGGLSKGVDREPFIAQIKDMVKKIYCFGKEAEELAAMCTKNDIASQSFATLEDAVKASIADMQSGDQIVLSPAGSSYDLYSNYIERGNHFKQLISAYNGSPQSLQNKIDPNRLTPSS